MAERVGWTAGRVKKTLGVVGHWFVFIEELFFKFADSLDQLGELLGGYELALGLKIRNRGEAHVLLTTFKIIQHCGPGSDYDFWSDCDVPDDPNLAAERRIFADLGTTTDTILGDDNTVFANYDIVADLHEVVDLSAFADHGVAQRAPVNRAVCPNLDIVLDHHAADLRDFSVVILVKNVAVAVGANHGAGMNPDTVS